MSSFGQTQCMIQLVSALSFSTLICTSRCYLYAVKPSDDPIARSTVWKKWCVNQLHGPDDACSPGTINGVAVAVIELVNHYLITVIAFERKSVPKKYVETISEDPRTLYSIAVFASLDRSKNAETSLRG